MESNTVNSNSDIQGTTQAPQQVVEHKVIYTEYREKRKGKGCGLLGDIFWRILTCIGCFLLLISVVIIGFIIWIHY